MRDSNFDIAYGSLRAESDRQRGRSQSLPEVLARRIQVFAYCNSCKCLDFRFRLMTRENKPDGVVGCGVVSQYILGEK
jgi:hypothetical protein